MSKKKKQQPDNIPHQFENSENLAVCHRDDKFKIKSQNELSKTICGHHESEVCNLCPLENEPIKEGINFKKNFQFLNTLADLVIIKDKEKVSIFIQPLEKFIQKVLKKFHHIPFTKREKTIVTLILEGKSNNEILEKLFISKPTLKSHLNHIYKKNPKLKDMRNNIKNK